MRFSGLKFSCVLRNTKKKKQNTFCGALQEGSLSGLGHFWDFSEGHACMRRSVHFYFQKRFERVQDFYSLKVYFD